MKERTKETIKDGFGSLVSNAAALRGAKNGPLWLTIVMFVLAVLLPLIPLFVSQMTTNGSSFLNKYSYGLERYVTSIALDLKNNRLAQFSIDENHLLSVKENGADVDYSYYGSAHPYATYENKNTHQYDFVVYLSNADNNTSKKALNDVIKAINYDLGTTTVSGSSASDNLYRPSYMILFKNGVYIAIYNSNSTKLTTESFSGDFKSITTSDGLKDLLNVKDVEASNQNVYNTVYIDGVYNNFKKFIDRSYDNLKITNTLSTVGIYAGIFFGLNIVMGFLMWLLTRGKNNPNNYFSPWLTMKIQARLGLAPGIITAIAGIFVLNMLPMIYIMTIGLRVMWISMKELRPIQA